MFYERIRGLRHSASAKITGMFFISFSLFLATAFTVTYFQISSSLETASHQVIRSKWQEINAVLSKGGTKEVKEYLSDDTRRLENSSFMVRVLSENNPIFQKVSIQQKSFNFDEGLQTDSLLKDGWTQLDAIKDEDRFEIYSALSANGLRLQIGQSSEDRMEVLEHLSHTFLWIGIVFSLLSGAMGFWYARKVLYPVKSLTETVKGIASGRFQLRAELKSTDIEFQELGAIFDTMVDRIERLINGMKSSVENIAHDLRTPLAKIAMLAERAIIKSNESERLWALQECAEYVQEISEFITQVLEISEVDAGTIKLHKNDVDLKSLASSVAEVYEFVALEKKILFKVIGEDLVWRVDEKRLKQAIGNLIDNAIKFSNIDSEIIVEVRNLNGRAVIQVTDFGIGISSDNLPHIFERLYRGDKSRSTNGAGLGLAVVQSVIKAHGGTVDVKTACGQGSTFTISLP